MASGFREGKRRAVQLNIRLHGQAVKTPPFHGGNTGSIPVRVTTKIYGRIAQLGEHLPYKQEVTGSIPVVPTILAQ